MLSVLCPDGTRYLLDTLRLAWTRVSGAGLVIDRGRYIERTDPITPGEGFYIICETPVGVDRATKIIGARAVAVEAFLDMNSNGITIQ